MNYSENKDYYQFLKKNDVIGKLTFILENRGYFLRLEDGFITATPRLEYNTPWHFVRSGEHTDCHLWHSIMFTSFGFPPSQCQRCFKVVVRPRTLKELFALLDFQLALNRPSKCGIEIRPSVHGLYGGYFYNLGLEEGLKCYSLVKEKMKEDPILCSLLDEVDENGLTKRLILKRGCTEFEIQNGRSDLWNPTEEQLEIEALVEKYCVRIDSMTQPEHVLWHVHKNWIEFAYEHGDKTYLEYTDGEPILKPVVTYHHLEGMTLEDLGIKDD